MRHASSIFPLACVAVALLLSAFTLVGCSSSNGTADPLNMVLDETVLVFVYDMRAIDTGETVDDLRERLEDDWDPAFGEVGILMDEVHTLVVGYVQEGNQYSILSGEFEFDFIRDELHFLEYEDDEYRGYEIWTSTGGGPRNASKVALLEESGVVLAGNFDLVPDILRDLSRQSGDAVVSDVARAIDGAGGGWLQYGMQQCPSELRGCEAFAGAVSTGERYELVVNSVFMFRNDRTAESQRDDVEDLSEDIATGDFVGVTINGEYVTLTATVDEEDFDEAISFDGDIFGW